tara:strand:- start:995 stop:1867 length:873 start_codon:yes stop_codon:yes gene_type:complete
MSSNINKYILLKSGIGNQLIPLISIMRMCNKFNYKLYIKFNKIVAYNFSRTDNKSFDLYNLIEINYDCNIINSIPNNCISCNCNWNMEKNIIGSNEKNNIFYYNVCHLFGGSNDNIKNYKPTPCKNLKVNNFLNELKEYSKLINPVKIIKEKLDKYVEFLNNLDYKVLGLHIRTLDGGFIEMYNEKKLFTYIENFIKDNKWWKIYISTDSKIIEDKLIDKYKDNILKLDEPFGNKYDDKFSDNNYGLMNSMYEIFVLSKCANFVGSAGSTFSFLSFLLSDNETLDFWNEQ